MVVRRGPAGWHEPGSDTERGWWLRWLDHAFWDVAMPLRVAILARAVNLAMHGCFAIVMRRVPLPPASPTSTILVYTHNIGQI